MDTQQLQKSAIVTAISLMLACTSTMALGEDRGESGDTATRSETHSEKSAVKHVDAAVEVVHKMEAEPGMAKVLQHAKGVFIIPSYGKAAWIVGGAGGQGVLLVKHDGVWSDPAFYTAGALSVGLQGGVQAGSIALVLNSDKAVNNFMRNNKFSLDADAGLTIINWSKDEQRTAGRGDVVAWSDVKGLFGDVAVGVSDIHYDAKETRDYYRQNVALNDVFKGKVHNPQSAPLKQALASARTATSTGSSGRSTTETGK